VIGDSTERTAGRHRVTLLLNIGTLLQVKKNLPIGLETPGTDCLDGEGKNGILAFNFYIAFQDHFRLCCWN